MYIIHVNCSWLLPRILIHCVYLQLLQHSVSDILSYRFIGNTSNVTDFLDLQAFPFSSLESYKILTHYASLQLKSPIHAQKQAVNMSNATTALPSGGKVQIKTAIQYKLPMRAFGS